MPQKKSRAKKPAETMRQKQMRLRRETGAKKLEKGPATVRGGQAPGAGSSTKTAKPPQPKRGGGTMVNRNKPTMRKLAAKAAQSRKAGSGRKLVRKEEMRKLMQKADKIKQGAKAARVPGDSGYVRAAQARGKAEVRKATARRGAKAAMGRMAGKLAKAKLLRAGGRLGRGSIHAEIAKEVLTARNTADGTLAAARKRGDYKPMQGPTSKTTQSSFNKKSFDDAFRTARKSGAKTFTWRGKKYTTKMK